jgi:tRNA (mo5U34)-methyltransferase
MYRKSIEPYINDLFQASEVDSIHSKCKTVLANKRTLKIETDLLPFTDVQTINKTYDENAVSVLATFKQQHRYTTLLKSLMPWRKGPFKINDVFIDSEWKSNKKWDRIATLIECKNKVIIDVGSGNGYYLYRLLGKGAKKAIGLDPHLLYIHQFMAINHIIQEQHAMVLPLGWQTCNLMKPIADYIVCMGVLYHQKNPAELFESLKMPLKNNGKLILETLIIESNMNTQLQVTQRYASMKNIYSIPSIKKLTEWLAEAGFAQITCCDITATTSDEQQVTSWSSGESLSNFMDPANPKLTIEGHPAPVRAIITAIKQE